MDYETQSRKNALTHEASTWSQNDSVDEQGIPTPTASMSREHGLERTFDLLLEELDQHGRDHRQPEVRSAVARLRDHFASHATQEAAWWTIARDLTQFMRTSAHNRVVVTDAARMLLLVHEQIEYTRELAGGVTW